MQQYQWSFQNGHIYIYRPFYDTLAVSHNVKITTAGLDNGPRH